MAAYPLLVFVEEVEISRSRPTSRKEEFQPSLSPLFTRIAAVTLGWLYLGGGDPGGCRHNAGDVPRITGVDHHVRGQVVVGVHLRWWRTASWTGKQVLRCQAGGIAM